MSKKTGTVLLSEQSKRISLRCPVILSSAKLMKDLESGKYLITVDLEYPMSVSASSAIRSVILVVRVCDRMGNTVPAVDESELLAKQIRFGEEGFPCGESTTFSFAVDIKPAEGTTRFGEPEVAVSRIHFEDGSIVDYLRGDFFPVPDSPVPLEKKYDAEGIAKIREHLGEQASVVPEKLSPVVWRCTCGELCQEEECGNCKNSRSDVFGYFGDTDLILHPGLDIHRLLKIALIIAGSLVGVLALTLTAILLLQNRGEPVTSEPTTEPVITTEPELPEDTLAAERARFYLTAGRYEDAWEVADKEAEAADMKPEICQAAIAHFREAQDYENACLFGERLVETVGGDASASALSTLYSEAYVYYTVSSDWERACTFAKDKLADSAKLTAAVNSWIAALKSEDAAPTHTADRFSECLWVVEQYTPENTALKEELVRDGVDALVAEHKFTEAEEFAAGDPDGGAELRNEIRRTAVAYYLELKDFLNAFEAAKRTDDPELISEVCEQIPDSELRSKLPSYITYLWGSPEKLRTVLAHTIAQNRFAARINADGTVSYGANRLFDPEPYGGIAVSVAVGTDHTAILLDSGRVVVLDRNGEEDPRGGFSGSNAIAISAASDYTLVLLDSGKVQVCGSAPFNTSKLDGLNDVISVAAGKNHALALRANGSVVAVGDNGKGQCNTGSWTDIVQIAAGGTHSVGLKSDGTIVGCGNDANGRMDFGGWTDVIAIAAGESSTAAIRQDGSVLFAGGTIGAKPADPTGLAGITEITAGQFGLLARDGNGTVYSRGEYSPDLDGFPTGGPARG